MECPLCGTEMTHKPEIDGCWERIECNAIVHYDYSHFVTYPGHEGAYDVANEIFFVDAYHNDTFVTFHDGSRDIQLKYPIEFSVDIFEKIMNLLILE